MRRNVSIILSCEHAGNKVPSRYRPLFEGHPDILKTHRGYDLGIAPIAKAMSKRLDCPLWQYEWTRLLIEPNRTRTTALFSTFTQMLGPSEKQDLIDSYYLPYRNGLDRLIGEHCRKSITLHLSMHSFTPVLNGCERNADIGILYDPARQREQRFAIALQKALRSVSDYRIRRNYPYAGKADGLTTWFRKRTRPTEYLGIEIELNQGLLTSPTHHVNAMGQLLTGAIEVCQNIS